MMQIHDCEQRSPEWFALRAGIPTASGFVNLMRSNGADAKTRRTYMLNLAGEILTGKAAESYSNGHMERGRMMEVEALDFYTFTRQVEPVRVGFITNGPKGCSPDALIGDDGMVEIKTEMPGLLIARLLEDSDPTEHKAQCQGNLWIAEREWIDCAIYSSPLLPLFVKRAHRDEAYIAKLAAAVDAFNEELQQLVERVRQYGSSPQEQQDRLREKLKAAAESEGIPPFLQRKPANDQAIIDAG